MYFTRIQLMRTENIAVLKQSRKKHFTAIPEVLQSVIPKLRGTLSNSYILSILMIDVYFDFSNK